MLTVPPTVVHLLTPDPTPSDGLTRRGLLGGLGGLAAGGVLTGCGADQAAPDGTAPNTVRTYVDATGASVDIPVRPQRILAVHANQTGQPLVSLGAPVVASTVMDLGFLDGYDTSGITDVSTAEYAVDVEQAATLRLDLVVSFTEAGAPTDDGNDYEALARLAPVVFIDTQADLDEVMAAFADVAGVPEAAERQRAAWEETADRLRGAAPAGLSVAYVATYDGTNLLGQERPNVAMTRVLDLVGVARPPVMERALDTGAPAVSVSGEEVTLLSADLMIWDPAVLDPAELPLWRTLPAVRAGQVASVQAGNNSYDAHQRVATEVEALVSEADPSLVDESAW